MITSSEALSEVKRIIYFKYRCYGKVMALSNNMIKTNYRPVYRFA